MDKRRSPTSHTASDEAFQRVVALQVYLPLVLGVVAVALAVTLALLAGGEGGLTSRGLADVSIILLLLPLMLLGLVALVGLAAVAIGVGRLVHWLPPRARKVQRVVARVARQAEDVADRSVQAVVVPRAVASGVRSIWNNLRLRR